MLALQHAVGNRALAALHPAVQRVQVADATAGETLYNKNDPTTGEATPHHFAVTPKYEMTRDGDSGVTVEVKIRFVSQTRNTVDPTSPGAPANTPALGAPTDEAKEIPSADARRAWATQHAVDAVSPWNGRLTLRGEEYNVGSPNTPKSLPVTFRAKAVFGLDEEAHNQVVIHPPATAASARGGNPIDAGNWYMNKDNDYAGANDNEIAAHEYGHLLGITDEYSQSNSQMNALLHQAAPAGAPSAMAALDQATVRRMVLLSLRAPLEAALASALPPVTDAIRATRPQVKKAMAAAARAGVVATDVRTALTQALTAGSEAGLATSVPEVVAFQTTRNFSNVTGSAAGVEAGFSAAALAGQISGAYSTALGAADASTRVTSVAGLGDVSINVQGSVPSSSAAGGIAAPAAQTAAGGTVGLPLLHPPSTLVGQLAALPTTWGTAGSAVETGVTPAAFSAAMAAAVRNTAAAAAPPPVGAAPAAKAAHRRELYRLAHAMVTGAAVEASRTVASSLVGATVTPVLAASVSDLQTSISDEVTRVMTTPAAGVAALGPPNPAMAAIVAHMAARLTIDKVQTLLGPGRDPLGTGGMAGNQEVTYSYQGMMGSNATRALRTDQFAIMLGHFNSDLRTFWERRAGDFTSVVR